MNTVNMMTMGASSEASPGASPPANPPPAVLPAPLTEPFGSTSDPMAMMLMRLETQGGEDLRMSAEDVDRARRKIGESQKKLLAAMEAAVKAAEAARRARKKKKKSGMFGRTFGGVIDRVAGAVAKVAEVQKDLVMVGPDMALSLGKSAFKGEDLMQALRADIGEFNKSSDFEESIEGATSGVARLGVDLVGFTALSTMAVLQGAVSGDGMGDALEHQFNELLASADSNIMQNPDFWKVAGKVAQGAAIAGALASGGAFAPVAVALIVALEADRQYGFIDKAVGPEIGFGVRLAMIVGAGAIGSGDSTALRLLQGSIAVLQGAKTYQEGQEVLKLGRLDSRALSQQATAAEMQQNLSQLQRLLDVLLGEHEEKSEHRTRTRGASAQLVQTQAATEAAVVMRA